MTLNVSKLKFMLIGGLKKSTYFSDFFHLSVLCSGPAVIGVRCCGVPACTYAYLCTIVI